MKKEDTVSKESLDIATASVSMDSNLNMPIEGFEHLGQLAELTAESKQKLFDYISQPKEIKTPAEKVKKRPDGFDYVESSWMDYQAKKFMPLYEYKLIHISMDHGWINVIVSLKDKITGNVELGADSARIMVKKDADAPSFRDIIDMGNNLKSALSKAIKNAQSRFGISADVYQKRESEPTEVERQKYNALVKEVQAISPTYAEIMKRDWSNLGTDWSDFLDKWQVYVDRKNSKQA